MEKIIKASEQVVYVLAAVILFCTVFCWAFHIKPAVIVSGSMEPTIKTGSMILINENERTIKRGDIISFETGGMAVAHRVAEVREDGYVTKGDSNKSPDIGIVTEDMITGTVILSVPRVGYVLKWMSAVPGIILTAAVAAALTAAGYFMGKEDRGEERG